MVAGAVPVPGMELVLELPGMEYGGAVGVDKAEDVKLKG